VFFSKREEPCSLSSYCHTEAALTSSGSVSRTHTD
jgi:hypothetical protein